MTAVYNLALAPSAMAKTRLHRSRPSPAFTLMMIGNVSKHVFSSVIHLPKKFSCIPEQVSSPQERVLFPSEVHGTSPSQSSCSASTREYKTEKEFECSENTTPVATEATTSWSTGPILPMEQLEAALSRTSLALDETRTPETPKASKPSQVLSISVRSPDAHPSTRESVVFRTPSSSGSSSVLQTLIRLREKVSCLERRPPRAPANCTSGRSPLPPIISGGETASSRSPLRPHRTVAKCAKGRGLYRSIRCFRASAWPQDKERFRMFLRLTRCSGTLAELFHANQSCARLNIPGDASIIPTLRGVL